MSTRYVKRKRLEGLAGEIFEIMASEATWSQWTEWLRVPLQYAAATGNQDIVHGLLMGGARANTIDDQGCAPLHFAARSGRKEVVSALLASGAEANGLDGDDGNSALILAAQEGHLTIVNALLAANADPNIRNSGGYSALDRAAAEGHVGILKAILAHGVDVDAIDEDDGMSALHHAAACGAVSAVDALVEAGGDIERIKISDGYTPLCCAAEESQSNTMIALMDHGANAEVRDSWGRTLLHLVCRGQCGDLEETIDLLLRRGADETAVTNRGRTPTDILLAPTLYPGDCFQDDIDRAQVLLARAPADRAWRRRCWLVMLRSRTSTAGRANYETGDAGGAGSNTTGGDRRRDGQGGKVAKGKRSKGGGHGEPEAASDGWNLSGIDGERPGLGGLVALLVGLEAEGVFRKVLGFL
ncbi:unnamed protein product [Ectocarpus fasciculatus]